MLLRWFALVFLLHAAAVVHSLPVGRWEVKGVEGESYQPEIYAMSKADHAEAFITSEYCMLGDSVVAMRRDMCEASGFVPKRREGFETDELWQAAITSETARRMSGKKTGVWVVEVPITLLERGKLKGAEGANFAASLGLSSFDNIVVSGTGSSKVVYLYLTATSHTIRNMLMGKWGGDITTTAIPDALKIHPVLAESRGMDQKGLVPRGLQVAVASPTPPAPGKQHDAAAPGDVTTLSNALYGLSMDVQVKTVGEKHLSVEGLTTPGEVEAASHILAADPDTLWIEPTTAAVEPMSTPYGTRGGGSMMVQQQQQQSGDHDPHTRLYDMGLTGEGQIIQIAGAGVDYTHCMFRDKVEEPVEFTSVVRPYWRGRGVKYFESETHRKLVQYIRYHAQDALETGGYGTILSGTMAGSISESNCDARLYQQEYCDDNSGQTHCNTACDISAMYGGVARDAKIAIFDVRDTRGYFIPPIALHESIFLPGYEVGARFFTRTWYPHRWSGYGDVAMEIDQFTWTHQDALVLMAVGDYGGNQDALLARGTVGSPSTAKNCVAVGGTSRVEELQPNSARGPTSDGRIKPDVLAPATTIAAMPLGSKFYAQYPPEATSEGNCGTAFIQDTHAAMAAATGEAALIRQYFTDGYYPDGVKKDGHGFTPMGALVKAVLVNSGRALTEGGERMKVGGMATLPNFDQGWGAIDLGSTLVVPGHSDESTKLYVQGEWSDQCANCPKLEQDDTHTYTIKIAASSVSTLPPLKITMVFFDYPGIAHAASAPVNNIDMQVLDGTTGTVMHPNGRTPDDGADEINSVEHLLIDSPKSGQTFTVTIHGSGVVKAPQPYALVVSGPLESVGDDDFDGDGIPREQDNCPAVFNPVQKDDAQECTPDECGVPFPSYLRDGFCDKTGSWGYNSEKCGWDGGDCCATSCEKHHETVQFCGLYGYDCGDPDYEEDQHPQGSCEIAEKRNFGNSHCDIHLNRAVCGYDHGDCCLLPSAGNCRDPHIAIPQCEVEDLARVGDGVCDPTGGYNTEECAWDMGDCCPETCKDGDEMWLSHYNAICGSVPFDCKNPACTCLTPPRRGGGPLPSGCHDPSMDGNSYTRCGCRLGDIGSHCSSHADACLDSPVPPCANGGTCTGGIGPEFICECADGYYGKDCGSIGTDGDGCPDKNIVDVRLILAPPLAVEAGELKFGKTDELGVSMASLNIDGDGVADLVVGAPGMNGNEGGVVVMMRKPNTAPAVHRLITLRSLLESGGGQQPLPTAARRFGMCVASFGDGDQNGVEDFIVGLEAKNDAPSNAYVVFLNNDGSVKKYGEIALEKLSTNAQLIILPQSMITIGDGISDDGMMRTTHIAVGLASRDPPPSTTPVQKWLGFYVLELKSDSGAIEKHYHGDQQAWLGGKDPPLLAQVGMCSLGEVTSPPQRYTVAVVVGDGALYIQELQPSNSAGAGNGGPRINVAVKNTLEISDLEEVGQPVAGSLASLGDLDGNGSIDVAIGHYTQDWHKGGLLILLLSRDSSTGKVSIRASQRISSSKPYYGALTNRLEVNAYFGSSVASLGEGENGVVELAVGAKGLTHPQEAEEVGGVFAIGLPAYCADACQAGVSCANGGACVEGAVGPHADFHCVCPDGFDDYDCGSVDHCAAAPCENGGVCTDIGDDYVCSCWRKHTGKNCELTQPMVAGGMWYFSPAPKTLSYEDASAYCTEKGRGHFGKLDWTLAVVVDDIQKDALVELTHNVNWSPRAWIGLRRRGGGDGGEYTWPEGNSVVEGVGGLEFVQFHKDEDCVWLDTRTRGGGYEVEVCAEHLPFVCSRVGQCASAPCKNGGVCTDLMWKGGDYKCTCQRGHAGKNCEIQEQCWGGRCYFSPPSVALSYEDASAYCTGGDLGHGAQVTLGVIPPHASDAQVQGLLTAALPEGPGDATSPLVVWIGLRRGGGGGAAADDDRYFWPGDSVESPTWWEFGETLDDCVTLTSEEEGVGVGGGGEGGCGTKQCTSLLGCSEVEPCGRFAAEECARVLPFVCSRVDDGQEDSQGGGVEDEEDSSNDSQDVVLGVEVKDGVLILVGLVGGVLLVGAVVWGVLVVPRRRRLKQRGGREVLLTSSVETVGGRSEQRGGREDDWVVNPMRGASN